MISIAEAYAKFAHLDRLLADREWLPEHLPGNILYNLWQAVKDAQEPCVWTEDDLDGKWDTACGNAFCFITAGPTENGLRYCPYCGRPLQAHNPA